MCFNSVSQPDSDFQKEAQTNEREALRRKEGREMEGGRVKWDRERERAEFLGAG